MVSRLAADMGNYQFKLIGKGRAVVEPHALMQISLAEFEDARSHNRGKLPDGYFAVRCLDDRTDAVWEYYAVGLAAERLASESRPFLKFSGPSKYRKDFLGVALAGLAARIWSNPDPISLIISYPPGHVSYRDELENATGTYWEVELEDRSVQLEFAFVCTAAEATGGLMNLILNADGKTYRDQRFVDGAPLVVDLGGGTLDISAMYTNGLPNPALQVSINSGVNEVYERLDAAIRRDNKALFPNATFLPRERVREALRTGKYRAGGHEINCAPYIPAAKSPLLLELQAAKERYMRQINADYLVLTGGGALGFQDDIRAVLNFHPSSVFLSSEKPEDIHLANPAGLAKFLLMMEEAGYVSYE